MKRSGGGAGDTVAIRDDILLSSEIWRANADVLGRVRCPPRRCRYYKGQTSARVCESRPLCASDEIFSIDNLTSLPATFGQKRLKVAVWRRSASALIVMLQGRRLTKDNIEAKNLAYKLPTQAMPKSINADMF